MSTIRFVDDEADYGYGVDGFSTPVSGIQTTFAVSNYLADIPFSTETRRGETIVKAYVKMAWRFKVQTVNFGSFSQKIFNLQTERGIYGEYRVDYRQYESNTVFHSHINHVSVLYNTGFFVNIPYDGEQDLPCDEPAVNLNTPVQTRFLLRLATEDGRFGIDGATNLRPGNAGPYVGDSVLYVPSNAEMEYIAGITYFFKVNVITEARAAESPLINIGI